MLWSVGVVAGLALAIWASRHALDAATKLGRHWGMSPFLVGMTIVAVGTDLPEVANSVIASARDHGDLNVGDSVGSAVTQITIVLGVLCFMKGLQTSRRFVVTTGAMTSLALLTGALLTSDGRFSRADGGLLIAAWLAGTLIIRRPTGEAVERFVAEEGSPRLLRNTAGALVLVGIGATVAVESFTRVAADLGAPEFLLSFFVLAAGTSLPELVLDARALRRGQGELAMGDLLGSSFVDATLSPGIGPLLFPHAISDGIERGFLVATVVVILVSFLLVRSPVPTRWTGVALIVIYLALYPIMLA